MKKMIFGSLIVGSVVAFTACGGGGGSTTTPTGGIADTDKAAITEANLPEINAMVVKSFDNATGDGMPTADEITGAGTSQKITKKLFQVQKTIKSSLDMGVTDTQNCPGGGTMTLDGDQTKGSVVFDGCKNSDSMYEETVDGTVAYEITDTSYSLTFTNFISTGKNTYNGQTSTWEENLEDVQLKMSHTGANAALPDLQMDISMTGSFKYDDYLGEFDNLTSMYKFSHTEGKMETSVDGFIKSSCLGGWIEIDTTKNIVLYMSTDNPNYCPSEGVVTVKGQGGSSVTLTYHTDGSATLSGDVNKEYATCNELYAEGEEGTCAI
jgi:hypothetical protein